MRILLDGDVVSANRSYTWDTTNAAEGLHRLAAEASDGKEVGRAELAVRVDNEGGVPEWAWVALMVIIFSTFVGLMSWIGSRRSGRGKS
jgi:hypothetical protein